MKPTQRLTSIFAAVLTLLIATAALAAGPSVKIEKKEGVGTYLADAKGMTLYTFKNDMPNMSMCAGGCAQKWPAFHEAKVEPAPGLNAADFGTIKRSDGTAQTTYKGMPLYYYAGDKKGGDTTGQGFKDVWYAAAP